MGKIGDQFEELVEIVSKLRSPEGCPWDREQTNHSLLPYFIEEVYEVIESIDENNWDLLKEELGDVLLHLVFQASIAEDNENFQILDSLENINKKLVRRHPHVFGDVNADAAFKAKQNWEEEKHKEKGRKSRLDGVPNTLPALIRAERLQQKASYAGFDWEKIEQVWEKVHEEILELKNAEISGVKQDIEEEIGDLIFAILNLYRHLNIASEDALRKTNQKFVRRFIKVEEGIKDKGKELKEASLEEMDLIWNEAKHNE